MKKINVTKVQYKIISNYFNKADFIEKSNQAIYESINDIGVNNFDINNDNSTNEVLFFIINFKILYYETINNNFNNIFNIFNTVYVFSNYNWIINISYNRRY